ncbi:MAG: ATP-binding cassette domain-containing protein, partial [Ferruginibacter sp.]
ALRAMRKNLQIVFQDPYGSLNPRLTIGSAIEEPIRLHEPGLKDACYKQQVFDLLERVELKAEHFNRYPHEFSGGQRQRICIARALALHPAFLIFDESVSALDVSIQAQILNLINDLKADFKFSSLFITHDLSVVKYISDRILVMQSGNIIEQGTALNVFQNPQQAYTKKLIDAIPGKRFLKPNQ